MQVWVFIEPFVAVRALSFPCSMNSQDDYESACLRRERPVVLTRERRDVLVPFLSYDKRTTIASSNGRRLLLEFPHLELLADDRLEPSAELDDASPTA